VRSVAFEATAYETASPLNFPFPGLGSGGGPRRRHYICGQHVHTTLRLAVRETWTSYNNGGTLLKPNRHQKRSGFKDYEHVVWRLKSPNAADPGKDREPLADGSGAKPPKEGPYEFLFLTENSA